VSDPLAYTVVHVHGCETASLDFVEQIVLIAKEPIGISILARQLLRQKHCDKCVRLRQHRSKRARVPAAAAFANTSRSATRLLPLRAVVREQ
jgi:hypothetical protein